VTGTERITYTYDHDRLTTIQTIAYVTSKLHRYVLVGSTSNLLLRSHQEESGLSWVGGLRVHVFEKPADVEQKLQAWNGQSVTSLETFIHDPLFTLITGGDAQGLDVRPGERALAPNSWTKLDKWRPPWGLNGINSGLSQPEWELDIGQKRGQIVGPGGDTRLVVICQEAVVERSF
jgi:hypothetical protein